MQRVDLGRCLVRVHAITEGQLGHATTVLPTEVVRYGLVILCCMCEGLKRKAKEAQTHGQLTHFTYDI